jgi:hypothetical protein
MSHRKPSAFRVTAHPIISGQLQSGSNPWAWLHQLSLERWEELIEANLQEDASEENKVFYVVKPGSDLVLECPSDIALQAYSDVLAGKTAPTGPGPLAAATVKKLQSAGGLRVRPASSESYM